jgi:hypothetical protein
MKTRVDLRISAFIYKQSMRLGKVQKSEIDDSRKFGNMFGMSGTGLE